MRKGLSLYMRKDDVLAVAERAGLSFTSYASVAEVRLKLKPVITLSVNADPLGR